MVSLQKSRPFVRRRFGLQGRLFGAPLLLQRGFFNVRAAPLFNVFPAQAGIQRPCGRLRRALLGGRIPSALGLPRGTGPLLSQGRRRGWCHILPVSRGPLQWSESSAIDLFISFPNSSHAEKRRSQGVPPGCRLFSTGGTQENSPRLQSWEFRFPPTVSPVGTAEHLQPCGPALAVFLPSLRDSILIGGPDSPG